MPTQDNIAGLDMPPLPHGPRCQKESTHSLSRIPMALAYGRDAAWKGAGVRHACRCR